VVDEPALDREAVEAGHPPRPGGHQAHAGFGLEAVRRPRQRPRQRDAEGHRHQKLEELERLLGDGELRAHLLDVLA
jgi:hypothetical protein